MVIVKIATLRICGVLKIDTSPVNRLGANLKIVRSTVNTATVLCNPMNKGNNVMPLD